MPLKTIRQSIKQFTTLNIDDVEETEVYSKIVFPKHEMELAEFIDAAKNYQTINKAIHND